MLSNSRVKVSSWDWDDPLKAGTPPGERIDKALTTHAVLSIPRDASSGEIGGSVLRSCTEM
jgi:hypothetical protein